MATWGQCDLGSLGFDAAFGIYFASLVVHVQNVLADNEVVNLVWYKPPGGGEVKTVELDEFKAANNGFDPMQATATDPKLRTTGVVMACATKLGLPPGCSWDSLPTRVIAPDPQTQANSGSAYVQFSPYFATFKLVGQTGPTAYEKFEQQSGQPLVITSMAKLGKVSVSPGATNGLPAAIRSTLSSVDDSRFDISHLFIDVVAGMDAANVTVSDAALSSGLKTGLKQYFLPGWTAALTKAGLGQITLAKAVVPKSNDAAMSPLQLTDVEMWANAWMDGEGKPKTPPLSKLEQDLTSLNYLCAMGSTKLPAARSLPWNWIPRVGQPSDPPQSDGMLWLRGQDVGAWFRENLQVDPNLVSPRFFWDNGFVNVVFGGGGGPKMPPWKAGTGWYGHQDEAHILGLQSEIEITAPASMGPVEGLRKLRAYYWIDVTVEIYTDEARLFFYSTVGNYCGAGPEGQLLRNQYQRVDGFLVEVSNGNLVLTPVSAEGPSEDYYTNTYTGMGSQQIENNLRKMGSLLTYQLLPPSVSEMMTNLQNTFFPAGKTFFFKNPCTSNGGDLGVAISYKSEN